jgi:hypothetical protein
MSSSWSFKDNLTIDNSKFLKWTDSTNVPKNIIGVSGENTYLTPSCTIGNMYINNAGLSSTFINMGNSNGTIIGSKLGVRINNTSTSLISALTLANNEWISSDNTNGSGYLGIGNNGSGANILLYGNNISGGNIHLIAGNTLGNINLYTGNNNLNMQVLNTGTTNFSPNGTTIRCSISDDTTIISNPLIISSTANSYSNQTGGALQIAGGMAIQGNTVINGTLSINSVSGNINFNGSNPSTSYSSGTISFAGGLGIECSTTAVSVTSGGGISCAGGLAVGQNVIIGKTITVLDTTDSTNALSGSGVFYGGMGINGKMYIKSDNASQINLIPKTLNNETSIHFGTKSDYTTTNGWIIGQNVQSAGTNTFNIYSYATSSPFMSLDANTTTVNLNYPTQISKKIIMSGDSLSWTIQNTSNNLQLTNSSCGILIKSDTGSIELFGTQNSSSFTSGSLIVPGGVAIKKDIYLGGNANISGDITTTNLNFTGQLYQNGSLYISSQWTSSSGGNLFYTSGNVGINTTSPNFTLDVLGGANFSIGITGNNSLFTNITSTNIRSTSIESIYSTITNSIVSNNISTNITCTNVNVSNINASTITSTSIIVSTVLATNLNASTSTITNCICTNISSTTLNVSTGLTTGTLLATSNISSASLNVSNSTITNSVFTNASSATLNLSTGLTTSNINFTGSLYQNGLLYVSSQWTSGTGGNLYYTNGNVGIGTVSPSATLDVNGTARFSTSVTSGALFATNSTMINVVATNMSTTNMTLDSQTVGTLFITSLISSSNIASNNMTVSNMNINTLTSSANITANIITTSNLLVTGGSIRVLSSSGTSHTIGTLRIDSNGVGILKNPGVAFDVQGIIRAESLLITNSGLQATGSNGHTLGTLFVTSTGNVGIGNTAPGAKLDVTGTARVSTSITSGALFATNSTITNSVFSSISTGILNVSTGLTTGTILATTSISTGQIYSTNSTMINSVFTSITSTNMKMTSIDALNATIGSFFMTNGNVGINTTSPGYILDVNGSIQAKGQVYFINTQPSNNATDGALMVTGGLSVNSGINSSSELNGGGLTVNGGAAVSGDLYIGGTLNCIGTASNSFAYITVTASDGAVNLTTGSVVTFGGITIQSTINSSSVNDGGSFLTPGGASIGQDVYVGGVITSSSDRRLKKNIRKFSSKGILDKIEYLEPIYYNNLYDNDKQDYLGFIAQDFEKDFPELLKKNSEETYYSLDYSRINVILMACIKELNSEIKQLKSQLNK